MPPSSPTRRRGAPIGNSNSFKHGFYSSHFKKRPPSADETTVLKSLADEIALIRVFAQRLIDDRLTVARPPLGLEGTSTPLPIPPSSLRFYAFSVYLPPPSLASCVSISWSPIVNPSSTVISKPLFSRSTPGSPPNNLLLPSFLPSGWAALYPPQPLIFSKERIEFN